MKLRRIVLICLLLFTLGLLTTLALAVYVSPNGAGYRYSLYDQTATALQSTNNYVETAFARTMTATNSWPTITPTP